MSPSCTSGTAAGADGVVGVRGASLHAVTRAHNARQNEQRENDMAGGCIADPNRLQFDDTVQPRTGAGPRRLRASTDRHVRRAHLVAADGWQPAATASR